MKIFKTPQEEQAAKAWLHDLFLAAEVKTENKRETPINFTPEFVEHAKILSNEFLNRDCKNVDASILCLAKYNYNATLEKGKTILTQPAPEDIAKYIVYMAQLLDLHWDFRDKDYKCRMEFGETILGHQVYISRQYLWLRDQKSGVIHPDRRMIYKIEGAGSYSTNLAQINPSSPHSSAGGTNIVKVAAESGNDRDCICYFFEKADAEAFLTKLVESGTVDSRIRNLHVEERGYVNDEGYLLFGTEFGDCVVEKSKLKKIWEYRVDIYKNGNPYNRMSDERWKSFVEWMNKE